MDKLLRAEIVAEVTATLSRMNEAYGEVWLTGDQLCSQVGMFTRDWLKRYGHMLPRERVRVTDADGTSHRTGWCYPRNRLLRMIHEGKLRDLRMAGE